MAVKKWFRVEDKLPELGQVVLLFAQEVVQEETYALDREAGGPKRYYWRRDDFDNEPPFIKPGQQWQELPDPPYKK